MPIHTEDERWQADRYSLDQESRNVSDVISIVQTADGALIDASNILQRMLDLARHSSGSSLTDRVSIQQEISAVSSELDRIADTTSFGDRNLLDGSFCAQSFQISQGSSDTVVLSLGNIRSNSAELGGKAYIAESAVSPDWVVTARTDLSLHYTDKLGDQKSFTFQAQQGVDRLQDIANYINGQTDDVKALIGEGAKLQIFAPTHKVVGEMTIGGNLGTELGFSAARDVTVADIDVTPTGGDQQAIAVLNGALYVVDSQRSSLDALEGRLNPVITNLRNIDREAAVGRIRDPASAGEAAALTKSQLLAQASASILAQAREAPSSVFRLLP